ncbi:MAG TPA: ATP-binding cassette domain-containing protein [Anaerolineaceae bacterium]|nr:ATP-binding cassette domain-containing protein [Anaerolineaceae bacterium]
MYPIQTGSQSKNYQSEALIELHQVEKTFKSTAGNFRALKTIDLKIKRGEFVGIIGKSGSGKSTLINMITGIDRPSGGEVVVDDIPVHKLNENKMAGWRGRNLGIVFQFFQLLPNLSILDNVRLPMDFCHTFSPKERHARAMQLLEMVDMSEHAEKLPSALSGGQQQRVAIARALANDPPIIIADEPTGNLDSKTADAVFHLFKKLADEGKTVVMVTHDSGLARRVERTVIIADGEVVNEYVAKALPALSPTLMLEVSRKAKKIRFAAGETIINKNTEDNFFYIVTEGMAEVSLRRPNGLDVIVDRMGPGQYFGEISLFTNKRTIATVRAIPDAALQALTLDRELFQKLLNESPEFKTVIQHVVSERLAENRSISAGKE